MGCLNFSLVAKISKKKNPSLQLAHLKYVGSTCKFIVTLI